MGIKKYDSFKHAKTHLHYHIIFSTKYRKDCLNPIRDIVFKVMNDIAEHSRFKILKIGIDGDHIHLLVKGEPNFAPYQIVRRLIQVSTRRIWKECEEYLRKYYWGKKKVLWTHGYFCGGVGGISEDKVLEYIEKQG